MIRYALKCSDEHSFESWFASADAFETLRSSNLVQCPICGSTEVSKAIMAPRVTAALSKAKEPGQLSKPMSEVEEALTKMRKHVEENSEYVGSTFADEARKMHDGDIPQRSIYGEARLDEAKKLFDDGVPVAPLPFLPQRKTN